MGRAVGFTILGAFWLSFVIAVVDDEALTEQCKNTASTLHLKTWQYKHGTCTIVTNDGKLIYF